MVATLNVSLNSIRWLALQVGGTLVPWTLADQIADDELLPLKLAEPSHGPPGHFSTLRPHKEPPALENQAELKPVLPHDKPPAQGDPAELKPVLPHDKPPTPEDPAELKPVLPHDKPPAQGDPAELKPVLPHDKPPTPEDPAELKPVLPHDKPPAQEDQAELKPVLPHDKPPAPEDPAELKPVLPHDKPPAQEDPAELKPVLPHDKPPAPEDPVEHQGLDKFRHHGNLFTTDPDAVSWSHSTEMEQMPAADDLQFAKALLTGTFTIILIILALACIIRQATRLVPFASIPRCVLTFPPTKFASFRVALFCSGRMFQGHFMQRPASGARL